MPIFYQRSWVLRTNRSSEVSPLAADPISGTLTPVSSFLLSSQIEVVNRNWWWVSVRSALPRYCLHVWPCGNVILSLRSPTCLIARPNIVRLRLIRRDDIAIEYRTKKAINALNTRQNPSQNEIACAFDVPLQRLRFRLADRSRSTSYIIESWLFY